MGKGLGLVKAEVADVADVERSKRRWMREKKRAHCGEPAEGKRIKVCKASQIHR